ncbi:hypothetical protein ACFQ48_05955 [Hymenobacter caeli]|uniref:Uncharacterized protein n=1 Tax=Hymenobacter caeli TaxID=2735894 RepID=A0ABX2FQ72_9BACT|nr:hypothetical protein [Hymenobacter caeli]NRT18575.1 hypothetical protein [Hymenobacter caeli]
MDLPSTFVDGTQVIFSSGNTIDFQSRILKILQLEQVIVIIPLRQPPQLDGNNVFAFTQQGDFLWRIEAANFISDTLPECQFVDAKVSTQVGRSDQLLLYNWCERMLRVNPFTGEVLKIVPTR